MIRALTGIALAATLSCTWTLRARAQNPAAPTDTLRLGALQDEAVKRDPRGQQIELLAAQSDLRLRSLNAERLPSLSVVAQGQYQSDVATIPFELPGGVIPPTPPNDTYDAHLAVRQRLYDPVLGIRGELEHARRAESQARVRASLYALRQSVNEAYFTVLSLQAQAAEVVMGITDLEAQLSLAVDRVEEGAALPSEAAMLEAEVLRRRQTLDQITSERDAASVVLGDLTGRPIAASEMLALPDLAAEVAQARGASEEGRGRPEYERFALSRQVIERQRESAGAQDLPRVSAFGRAGYGRPGLNPLASRFDTYWLTGVQVEWTPWHWGTTQREQEELALQQEILASDEAAFSEGIHRDGVGDLAGIDRLERALRTDDAILALREQILAEARLRYGEGVITSAEYVDRETDVLAARLARAAHRVELARTRARFLTLIGFDLP